MESNETRICPQCGEEIKAKAIKCRYCHSNLDESTGIIDADDKTNISDIESQKSFNLNQLLPLIIQTGVGIFILLIIWLIIANLPMLNEISTPLDFTLPELLSAVILSIIVAMLINFAIRVELRLKYLLGEFSQVGNLVKNVVFMITILIIYFAFKPIVIPYIGDLSWVYHLLFLIAFILLLAIIGISVYSNVEMIVNLVSDKNRHVSSNINALKCVECQKTSVAGKKYCSHCGSAFPQKMKCPECNTLLKPGAKYCSACGADINDSKK